MTNRPQTTAAALAGLALLLGACSTPVGSDPPTDTSSGPAAPSRSAPTSTRLAFDQTHTYPDGVTLKISEITERRLGPFPVTDEPGAEEGDPYAVITLAWENGSKAEVVLTPYVLVRVGADGHEASRVAENEERDQINLEPGQSTTYDVAVIIHPTDRSKVVVEIIDTPDPDRNIAFAGAVPRS